MGTTGERRMRLLNPGPVTLTERVRGALQRPDLCHREPEFYALAMGVRGRIEPTYRLPNIKGFNWDLVRWLQDWSMRRLKKHG